MPIDSFDMETSNATINEAVHGRQRPSQLAQFAAVLKKNFILQTRSRKAFFGIGGWAALLIEMFIPGLFFLLMCIPKYYIPLSPSPRQLPGPAYSLDSNTWARPYHGPAVRHHHNNASILFAPNTTAVLQLMEVFARQAACPSDPTAMTHANSFYQYFKAAESPSECQNTAQCFNTSQCYQHVVKGNLQGFASEADAVDYASQHPRAVDAVLTFEDADLSATDFAYTIRMNHTHMPSSRQLLNVFDILPDAQYRRYWFFTNLQQLVDQAIIAVVSAKPDTPIPVSVSFKPFPWPAVTVDIGAAASSIAFNLLLVYSFLAPTRSTVASIVREKELRLREGMRILGLKKSAYWSSWALTHFSTMAVSGILCAVIGLYPFRHSSFAIMLSFYWLLACSLISFSYFLSTIFSKSRVAGTVTAVLYALAMVPGFLMPSLQPYGGRGWTTACLLPPSCISLYANVLLKLESAQRGISRETLHLSVNSQSPFSAATVFQMLLLDIVLYAVLTWYLDQVLPSDIGQRQPFYFFLQPSYWIQSQVGKGVQSQEDPESPLMSSAGDGEVSVSINKLRKHFTTTDGSVKHAVDGLDLDIYRGQITALLGHNGAGKTTTISMLTGTVPVTSGDAIINGLSVKNDMTAIRQDLGVCPQFDILWPEITVKEHLMLYAAIKGFTRQQQLDEATAAAHDIGLDGKLDTPAGDLSGGQRRKLSVAIAFLGSPAVVFLDEPTSGMDPYSRRFTWDVIKKHRRHRAIVLTTHSMEEADVLCDRIAIMVEGRLATVGTSLDLKSQFGVGYTLTVVKARQVQNQDGGHHVPRSASDDAIVNLVRQHVPASTLSTRGGTELAFKLPRDESNSFAALLTALEECKAELGVLSCGLSVTTLEEVFLKVSSGSSAALDQKQAAAYSQPQAEHTVDIPAGHGSSRVPPTRLIDPSADQAVQPKSQGVVLYWRQFWALFVKRAISAKRDRLAVVLQLLVPILLVLLALRAGNASSAMVQEPSLDISRHVCLMDKSAAFAASAGARANATGLDSFLSAFPKEHLTDTHEERMFGFAWGFLPNATLESYLLQNWFTGRPAYDAVFINSLSNTTQVMTGDALLDYTLLINQTAIHSLPAVINAVNTALLRATTGDPQRTISLTRHPLPLLQYERKQQVAQETGSMLLVLLMTMATASLSASFSVFLVRERANKSKHVQTVSGAPPTAFWGSVYLWDLINYAISAAGIVLCFQVFGLAQFQGERLTALTVLLGLFGLASLPLTYFLHFFFTDEVKALGRLNIAYFLVGFLGFLTTWILDMIYMFLHKEGVLRPNQIIKGVFSTFGPHYLLSRCLYDISQTYKEESGLPNTSPFTYAVSGRVFILLCLQAAAYYAATLLLEVGWLQIAYHYITVWLKNRLAGLRRRHHSQAGYEQTSSDSAAEGAEDEDVQEERLAVQSGTRQQQWQVLLKGLEKQYSQGSFRPPVRAVDGLWLGIPEGECFGLLGVNGAGKTTTFSMLTGETMPNEGSAYICGHSMQREMAKARQLVGYCPQFDALAGTLTGREVLRMYGRLRGVPSQYLEPMVDNLLQRLGLGQYADRVCDSYSGGNKRKLSVAIALVGDPPAVLMDEPSTGMDPGAKRFLWDLIQKQVVDAGHTVILTSHSMEECEALCTRIGIMTAGRLRCLGTVQHLKNRFGAGYCLDMRLQPARIEDAVAFLQRQCPTAQLLNRTADRLSFSIPQQGLDLPALFAAVESNRSTLQIEDYSLSQTTLEQVFVALAQQNTEQQLQ